MIRGAAIGRGRQEAARERPDGFEAARQALVGDVPFPGHEGVVAGMAEGFTPERRARSEAGSIGASALPESAASVQHRPAGNAHRAAPAALVKAMREEHPTL